MSDLIDQPTARPTNKLMVGSLSASVVGLFVWEVFGPKIIALAAALLGISLGGPAAAVVVPELVGLAIAGIAGIAGGIGVGWFKRDRPNQTTDDGRRTTDMRVDRPGLPSSVVRRPSSGDR